MKKNNYILFALINFLFLNLGCREEIALETETFESVLVVEATITNELKRQEVKVSRTYLLEETEQAIENNAEVRVTDNTGNSFNFSQNTEGVYISDATFEALPNVEYTLEINTTDGKTYNSNQQTLTPISQIDNLYAEFVDDDVNGPGVQVFVDSDNSGTEAKYFRYEYEETYQVVAPYHYSLEVILSNYIYYPENGSVYFDTEVVERIQQEKTCYNTFKSQNIIQSTTNNLNENNVLRFPIRFIAKEYKTEEIGIIREIFPNANDLSMLRDRYSILVKQYVQNIESFSYYKNINTLGNNDNILSENQPGYVNGNINGENVDKKVIGFFSVSSVSKSRIFFNYENFSIPQPKFIYECDERLLDYDDNTILDDDKNERAEIYRLVNSFQEFNMNYQITSYPSGIWSIANPECSDCTSVGTNIQPDFWLD